MSEPEDPTLELQQIGGNERVWMAAAFLSTTLSVEELLHLANHLLVTVAKTPDEAPEFIPLVEVATEGRTALYRAQAKRGLLPDAEKARIAAELRSAGKTQE